jgi:hypothetical protein
MIYKNVADQKLAVYAYTVADGAAKTGDAANITCYLSKDWAGAAALTDTNPTELDATNMKGWYVFDLAQAETNAEVLIFSPVSATAGVVVDQVQVFTQDAAISSRAPASTALTNVTWTDARAGYLDKAQYLPAVTAGNAGGVFIAGTNAATSVTTALTANITGNLSGSVGSVTGAVGSVTGAVGSVTGAVGSVTGAVGSVGAGGIAAASFAADAIAAAAVSAAAVTKIQTGLATPTNITAGTITTVSGNVTGTVGGIAGTITTIDALWAKVQKWLRLALRKDAATATDCATELAEINANGGSGAGAYANTTDAQEAIRDTEPLGTAMRGTDSAVLATTVGVAGAGLTALGDTRLANLDAAISTRSVYAGGAVASVTGAVGSVAGLNAANLDVAVSTRAATGEAAAAVGTLNDFNPASDVVASVTTVGTVTNPVTAGTVSDKTGYALAATGLDSITATTPTGVATTFPQKLVQLWHRFFGKVTMTATQLKTYDDAGTGVLTTQTTSDDGTTQTQGKAT